MLYLSLLRVSYPHDPPPSLTIFRVYFYNKEVRLCNQPNRHASTGDMMRHSIYPQTLFKGSPVVSVIPCSKDAFQGHVLHLVALPVHLLCSRTVPGLPGLCDFDTLEDDKPFVSRSVLQSGFVCLLIIRLRFCPSRNISVISLYAIRWHMIPVCFIINDVYSDYLIKVVSASFPHCKLTNFSFVINKRFMGVEIL